MRRRRRQLQRELAKIISSFELDEEEARRDGDEAFEDFINDYLCAADLCGVGIFEVDEPDEGQDTANWFPPYYDDSSSCLDGLCP